MLIILKYRTSCNKGLLKIFNVNDPLEIHYDADLPEKSGIDQALRSL